MEWLKVDTHKTLITEDVVRTTLQAVTDDVRYERLLGRARNTFGQKFVPAVREAAGKITANLTEGATFEELETLLSNRPEYTNFLARAATETITLIGGPTKLTN